MATACPKCSTENADGALVCRQCGAALPPPQGNWSRSLLPEDDHFDPLSAPTLVMQHTAPAALPPIEESLTPRPARRDPRRLLLGVAGVVVLVAAGAWLLRPAETPAPTAPLANAGPAAASAPEPVASIASAPVMAASAAPAAASAPANDPTPAIAMAAQPVASAAAASSPAAAPASAVPGRKRIPEPVARKRAAAAAPAASTAAPVAAAASAPAPVVAPPPAPERQKTVGELCAGGNLITRGFCEQRECARSEHANDPVCARLKDAEQRRLFQQ